MIISIDGPAGSGKSTIADVLAEKLGFVHFNSGSLYRAITAYAIKNNIDIDETTADQLSKLKLEAKFENNVQHVYVEGEDYTPYLRDNEVSVLCPLVSKFAPIRATVDNCQHTFASTHNVVIEGRDIGSFVFPNAEFKFYLDCDVKERAKRRFKEEQLKGTNVTIEEIEAQLIARDKFDKEKKLAPLVVPKGAIRIDSSKLTVDQVTNEMLSHIKL